MDVRVDELKKIFLEGDGGDAYDTVICELIQGLDEVLSRGKESFC